MKAVMAFLERLSTRPVVLGLWLVGGLLLQSAVLPHMTVYGYKPDLLTVIVACWGLLYGPEVGFVVGLVGGLLHDLAAGQHLGLFALTRSLTGLLAGFGESKIFKDTVWVPAVVTTFIVFVHEVLVWVCLRLVGTWAPAIHLVTVALPGALLSGVLAPVVYRQAYLYFLRERARESRAAGGGLAGQVSRGSAGR